MSATKAAPRDKATALQSGFYLVTESPHYLGLKMEPVGAIVRLPEGVNPGRKLVPCDAEGNPVDADAEAAADKKKADKAAK